MPSVVEPMALTGCLTNLPCRAGSDSAWAAALTAAKRHDFRMFGPFLEELTPLLEKAALRCVPQRFRHELLGADLAQEAIARGLAKIHLLPGGTRDDCCRYFLSIAESVARNAVQALQTKKRAGHSCRLDTLINQLMVTHPDPRQPDPALEAEQSEMLKVLSMLWPAVKEIDAFLALWHFEGISWAELADIFGTSPEAARKQVARILSREASSQGATTWATKLRLINWLNSRKADQA